MAEVHLISKVNNADHEVIKLALDDAQKLGEGAVRVRTSLISLTANNLAYARGGDILHWWSAYPVPSEVSRHDLRSVEYGIVPAWGFGEILESSIQELEPGTLLWGFWPSSSLPVVLNLEPGNVKSHWIEKSEHRTKLMSLYNRYLARGPKDQLRRPDGTISTGMAMEALLWPIGEAAWLLNHFVFGQPPIHPFGRGEWTSQDADLTSTVLISLSASSKTARMFTEFLVNDRKGGSDPAGLLAITTNPQDDIIPPATFPTKKISYNEIGQGETARWVSEQKAKRIVIINFAGRGNSLPDLLHSIERDFPEVTNLVLQVGGESRVLSSEESAQAAKTRASVSNLIQCNASGIRDTAMSSITAEAYFRERQSAWDGIVARGFLKDLTLEIGKGIAGDRGFASGWRDISRGSLPSTKGLVYEL